MIEEEKVKTLQRDEDEAREIVTRNLMGPAMSLPGGMLAEVYGDHWRVPEEQELALGKAFELWVANRFGLSLSGPRLFDVAFFGMLLMVYGPRVLAHIQVIREQEKQEALKARGLPSEVPQNGNDIDIGWDGNGEVNESARFADLADAVVDSRPARGTLRPDDSKELPGASNSVSDGPPATGDSGSGD